MAKPRTQLLMQDDLFGAAQKVGVVVAEPAPKRRRVRKVDDTQRAAHDAAEVRQPTTAERCEWDIKGNSRLGRTRQEIADRLGIKLQSVCGAVDRLLKTGVVIEPVIGFDAAQRPVHYTRAGGKVVVNALYSNHDWLAFGRQHLGSVA